jgi:hypothetical protein
VAAIYSVNVGDWIDKKDAPKQRQPVTAKPTDSAAELANPDVTTVKLQCGEE